MAFFPFFPWQFLRSIEKHRRQFGGANLKLSPPTPCRDKERRGIMSIVNIGKQHHG
jgi:hypothetical protein